MFVKITTPAGDFVSEFKKLRRLGKYASDIFAGRKAFNVWRTTATVHPSGETVLFRTRTLIPASQITALAEVEPLATRAEGSLDAAHFQPAARMQRGQFGTWLAPDGVAGATPGERYPIHREPDTLRRYVNLAVPPNGPATTYFLDATAQPAPAQESSDEDEDEDTF